MVDIILGALLVFCIAHGNFPAISTALAAALTWRVLPFATNELVTGIILIVGGVAARRRRPQRDD
jgi:hypothetical protein